MPDVINRGLAWLAGKRHSEMVRAIVYQRGSDRIELDATAGRTRFEKVDQDGSSFDAQTADWLIRSEDLVLRGRRLEPQRIDFIHWEDEAGNVHTYQVLADGGLPPFSYTEASRRTMRVRTKHLKTEAAA